MRKNIYIIIGEGNCGKSTLVRALTIQDIPQFPTNPQPVLVLDSWDTAASASADIVRRGWRWM